MILDWRQQQKLKATFFWLVDWAAKLAAASFFKQPISEPGIGCAVVAKFCKLSSRSLLSATHCKLFMEQKLKIEIVT